MEIDMVKKLQSHMDRQHLFGDGNYMDTPFKNMNKKLLVMTLRSTALRRGRVMSFLNLNKVHYTLLTL